MHHISQIELMAAQLKDLNAPITDVQLLAKIILTLPPSYRHFISAWESVPEASRTIAALTARLVNEEKMTKMYNNGAPDPADTAFFARNSPGAASSETSTTQEAYSAAGGSGSHRGGRGGYPGLRGGARGSRGNYRGPRGGNRTGLICHYCQKPGHHQDACWVKEHDESNGEAGRICHYCHKKGHVQAACHSKKRDEKNKTEAKTVRVKEEKQEEFSYTSSLCFMARSVIDWFADSGATAHMTDQRSFLTNFTTVPPGVWKVAGIGNTQLEVKGMGCVEIISVVNGKEHTGVLKKVLYVPGLGINLFSIGTVTAAGVQVIFDDNRVSFSRDGSVHLEGQRAGKTLYHLNLTATHHGQEPETVLAAVKTVSLPIWHQRFAHLNNKTLLKMAASDLVTGLNLASDCNNNKDQHTCGGCILGNNSTKPI